MDRSASPASSIDSAVAEKQLLHLETFLGQHHQPSGRSSMLGKAQRAFSSVWERVAPQSNPPFLSLGAPEDSPTPATLSPAPKPRLRRTAYLDGLKGFAALLVYILHNENWAHPGIDGHSPLENVFGWDGEYYFVNFPGIRTIFSGGHFAVANFFIISGYVLSSKPLSLIHQKETLSLSENVGSALFRRWPRLYLPVAATTLCFATSFHLFGIRSSNGYTAKPSSSYPGEIATWIDDFRTFSFVFGKFQFNTYNDHLWSIPLEFRGSVVVYASLLALSRASTNARLLCEAGLAWYFLYFVDAWYCALFMTGVLLCDLDLLAADGRLPSILRRWNSLPSWVAYICMAAGLYLGAIPAHTEDLMHLRKSPGYWLVSFLKPKAATDFRWFYLFWGAVFINIAVPRIPKIKAFFETTFCQYLGRICYGLYLVHGPVLWTLGDRMYAAVGRVREGHTKLVPNWINLFPFPSWGPMGLELNFLMPQLILLPITLLLAELITRYIDEPSVKISQWMFKKTLDDDQDVLTRHSTEKRTEK